MVSKKKSSHAAASHTSSAGALAASAITPEAQRSSVLRSCFSPSEFHLYLFASVIQGLDSQHLRLHDTRSGRLHCEHTISPTAEITCLDWGYYGSKGGESHQSERKKKRKRTEHVNGIGVGQDVLAYGTTESSIHIFSPSQAKDLARLDGAHTKGIRDFKFVDRGRDGEGWSLGGDGQLVQWNISKGDVIRWARFHTPSTPSLPPSGASKRQPSLQPPYVHCGPRFFVPHTWSIA